MPGGRAVVGGLLVAASAVGVFAAHEAAVAAPSDRYVTAARDVAAGEVLRPADLALVAVELPDAQRRTAFSDAGVLIGTVAVSAMREHQLVQAGDVARSTGDDRAELSVSVEPGNAMNGDPRYLRAGERVDVVVTADDGNGTSTTRTVAVDVAVVDVLDEDGRLGGSGRLTVVLSLPGSEVEAVAGANASGTVTLVRTTGMRRPPG